MMRYEDFESDLAFTSRLGTLSVAFTGVNFAREDVERASAHQVLIGSELRKRPGLMRVLKACSSWAASIRQRFTSRLRRRRTLARLEGLDRQLLHDIGLSYNDIRDLRYGQTSIEQINARKYSKDAPFQNPCFVHIVSERNNETFREDSNDFRRAA